MGDVDRASSTALDPDAGASRPPERSRRTGWAVVAGFALLAAIPVLVALVALRHPHWFPAGDMAQAELHVRGFWNHPPLVGAAGRLGTLAGPRIASGAARSGWRCTRSTRSSVARRTV